MVLARIFSRRICTLLKIEYVFIPPPSFYPNNLLISGYMYRSCAGNLSQREVALGFFTMLNQRMQLPMSQIKCVILFLRFSFRQIHEYSYKYIGPRANLSTATMVKRLILRSHAQHSSFSLYLPIRTFVFSQILDSCRNAVSGF
jgi:hypothetical protein